jgi:hypothetical protein
MGFGSHAGAEQEPGRLEHHILEILLQIAGQ